MIAFFENWIYESNQELLFHGLIFGRLTMTVTEFLTIFTTLFVIIDPIGLTPIFIALTPELNFRQRRKIALRSSIGAFFVLVTFAIFGEGVLLTLGIDMPAFEISGGILLFIIAIQMLFQKREERRKKSASNDLPDPSIFPLTTPLIAGPGAIAAVVLISSESSGDFMKLLSINLIIMLVIFLVFLFFLTGNALERVVGKTGIDVISRLLGMLLAALSVQFIINGLVNLGVIA